MLNRVSLFSCFVAVLLFSHMVQAKPTYNIEFLSKTEATHLLTLNDDFVQRVSQFDIDARMKQDTAQSKGDYLGFVAQQTLDWTPQEQRIISDAFNSIALS